LAAATGLAATDPFFWLATGLGDALGTEDSSQLSFKKVDLLDNWKNY
jgi:hypothetical protein